MAISIREVYEAIRSKKSPEICARRLEISLPEYLKLRSLVQGTLDKLTPSLDKVIISALEQRICSGEELSKVIRDFAIPAEPSVRAITQKIDPDKGTGEITATFSFEPRTPEEIIEVLKIDTSHWRLATYYNKEQSDGTWRITAFIAAIRGEEKKALDLAGALSGFTPAPYIPIPSSFIHTNEELQDRAACGVISLQDMHFGKPGNERMGALMGSALLELLTYAQRNCYLEELVLVLGGDTLNADTFTGTTTKGTLVENSENVTKAYRKAFTAARAGISLASQFTRHLRVIFIPGNHDRLSSYHLLHALEACFEGAQNITFDTEYAERKVLTYGDNMLCFEHGDVARGTTPLVYATEFPEAWGSTRHRTLFTGHLHTARTTDKITDNEIHGFRIRILPALTTSDYYHYHNKWTGNTRAARIELYRPDGGYYGEHNYIAPTYAPELIGF